MRLTPNRRLAEFLKEQSAIPVAAITEWLETCFDAYALQHRDVMPYRLNEEEEIIL